MLDIKVMEVMTTQLITINENDNISLLDKIFKSNNFHHLPVVNNNKELVGIVSQTDFDRIKSGASLFRNPNKEAYQKALLQTILVEQIMTRDVLVCRPTDPLENVYKIFKNRSIRALPVMDRGELNGIVTPMDILDYIFKPNLD